MTTERGTVKTVLLSLSVLAGLAVYVVPTLAVAGHGHGTTTTTRYHQYPTTTTTTVAQTTTTHKTYKTTTTQGVATSTTVPVSTSAASSTTSPDTSLPSTTAEPTTTSSPNSTLPSTTSSPVSSASLPTPTIGTPATVCPEIDTDGNCLTGSTLLPETGFPFGLFVAGGIIAVLAGLYLVVSARHRASRNGRS